MKEAGLVRERTTQRTDSTHLLAAVLDLTRLELVTEAVRAALEELARTAGHALAGLAGDDWGRHYGHAVRLGKNPTRPKTRMNEAGADASRLLGHLAARCPGTWPPAGRACCTAPRWKPCGRSWSRTTTGTPPALARRRERQRPSAIGGPHRRLTTRPPATPAGLGHPLDRLPHPRHRDLRRRQPQRHHRRRHHVRHQRRHPRPGRHPRPAGAAGAAPPPSTWPTADTHRWCTWNEPGASTRSPSPGRCPATPPGSTAPGRATPRGRLTWQAATVASVTRETASVITIEMDPPDWPGHRAGQHLDVRLTAEDGYTAEREYSIASAPGEPVAITVERIEDGEVSPYLTSEIRAGDQLELRGPVGGYFVWEPGDGGPLLLQADPGSSRCDPSCGTGSAPAAASRRGCCTPPAPCRT